MSIVERKTLDLMSIVFGLNFNNLVKSFEFNVNGWGGKLESFLPQFFTGIL